ncbi:MAG TPA: hypothetical protein VFR38_09645 [Gaiellaceae bacterium]|nr:hypothetical protein [Gaiellaceae bacterium]
MRTARPLHGALRAGLLARLRPGRSEAHAGVTRCLRMVRERGEIGFADRRVCDCPKSHFVQPDPAVGRERLLDRKPCELVAEPYAALSAREHARRETLVEVRELVRRESFQ